jgi:Zn-dependent M16 (insulinase) family peptidase
MSLTTETVSHVHHLRVPYSMPDCQPESLLAYMIANGIVADGFLQDLSTEFLTSGQNSEIVVVLKKILEKYGKNDGTAIICSHATQIITTLMKKIIEGLAKQSSK